MTAATSTLAIHSYSALGFPTVTASRWLGKNTLQLRGPDPSTLHHCRVPQSPAGFGARKAVGVSTGSSQKTRTSECEDAKTSG